jgi:hypothetical protein
MKYSGLMDDDDLYAAEDDDDPNEWTGFHDYPYDDDDDESDCDWWIPDDEPEEFEYDYFDEPPTFWERVRNEINYRVWRVKYFWNYTLNMRRCIDCGWPKCFGNHDDCYYESSIPF